ncbi:septum-promoting GTP-binding protein 1-like [Quercus lobata]|uniref:septum-promoting GTP-binding protein 1-like n=1 Tax=Quercus lobata TaxID=97700 RepID=UPI0012477356|nr:septum-promoting GTP-binding protein 1-like [Quercus lobata]
MHVGKQYLNGIQLYVQSQVYLAFFVIFTLRGERERERERERLLLGDYQIGKTSFLIKYVGDEQEKRNLEMAGLNLMDKTLSVQGARISLEIWDVGGDHRSLDHVPMACKDAVAILFKFDLTSRTTLNSFSGWYNEARKFLQTAIPIIIGTKFDDFVRLPPDLQWTIVTQVIKYFPQNCFIR